jgi:hypothetical protein
MIADEIVNQERGFADARTQAAATPAHLRVFDGGFVGRSITRFSISLWS